MSIAWASDIHLEMASNWKKDEFISSLGKPPEEDAKTREMLGVRMSDEQHEAKTDDIKIPRLPTSKDDPEPRVLREDMEPPPPIETPPEFVDTIRGGREKNNAP